jgi:ribosomal protein S18 acetylase RimI-like enzyme
VGTTHEEPITVRAATEADRVTARAFIQPTTPRGRASLVLLRAGQGLLWVAFEGMGVAVGQGEKLVGLLLATVQIDSESEDPVGYIHELLVHPAYRRRGVAMHLLDAAERYFLEEQGFPLIHLATSPDNDAALRLYRSRGYTVYQVRLAKRRATPSADTSSETDARATKE